MQTALIVLELLGRFNKVAIDTRVIAREFGITGEEITPEEFIRISRRKGFKTSMSLSLF